MHAKQYRVCSPSPSLATYVTEGRLRYRSGLHWIYSLEGLGSDLKGRKTGELDFFSFIDTGAADQKEGGLWGCAIVVISFSALGCLRWGKLGQEDHANSLLFLFVYW
jgi:hypothetical protein